MEEILALIPSTGIDYEALVEAAREAGTPLNNTNLRALRKHPGVSFVVSFDESGEVSHVVSYQAGGA